MGALRDRMEADLQLRGLSDSTCDVYLRCAYKFAEYFRRSPAEMGSEEVREFFGWLFRETGAKPSTVGCYAAALKFLYGVTLERPEVAVTIPRPKVPRQQPTVLSGTEVESVFEALTSRKYKALYMLMYGTGLRVHEACEVQVDDIDGKRGLLCVREGKGGHSRYAVLGQRLLEELRGYWAAVRPRRPWLFPGRNPTKAINPRGVQRALREAARSCGITKYVTPHTLRHSYATHLEESGVDIRTIQVLLGHACLNSTARYAQVRIPTHPDRVFRLMAIAIPNDGDRVFRTMAIAYSD